MTHAFYDQTLNNEQERMRAFDTNKVPGRFAAEIVTQAPMIVAPKFAKRAKAYRRSSDILGDYLKESATEAEQLDAVRLPADYHALCEDGRWGE